MKSVRSRPLLLAAALAIAGCTSVPQPPPPPPFLAYNPATDALPDPVDDAARVRERAIAAGYAIDEAGVRMNLIQLFATRARQASLPGFHDVWISFRDERDWINVGTTGEPDRAAYLAMAAPEIRDAVRFRHTSFTKAEADAAVERVSAAVGPDGGWCVMGYDAESDWLVVNLEETTDRAAFEAKLPEGLRPLVKIEIGGCPIVV